MSMRVGIVSAERKVFDDEAEMVVARTTEGELGVLGGHEPVLAQLAEGGVVRVHLSEGGEVRPFAVHGGFLSVSADGVSILARTAEPGDEIDVSRAKKALERAEGAGSDDEEAFSARRRAQARLRAAGEGDGGSAMP